MGEEAREAHHAPRSVPPPSPPPPPSFQPFVGPPPAQAAKNKRPRYLVVALVTALVFGAGCWTEGCAKMALYRGDHDNGESLNSRIHDDTERAQAETLFQRYIEASERERSRGLPLGIATFVLGAALLALASRGLAGKSNTRSALMQVVLAQAIVVGATYFATPQTRNAENDWQWETVLFTQHKDLPPEQFAQAVPMIRWFRRFVPPGWLAIRSSASALILLALSRKRSREFFEAAATTQASES